jgi:hypothetical protein
MLDFKILFGYIAIIIAVASYLIYFRQIYFGKIKPHAFSWFIWGLMTGTAFAAQLVKGAGFGAWVTGITTLASFIISGIGFYLGRRDLNKTDWTFLLSALLGIILWWVTKEPLLSIILVTVTDLLASSLTFRKSYYKPFEESATIFTISGIKWIAAIFALETYVIVTWLYPASLIVTNLAIVSVILIRRRGLRKKLLRL